MYRLYKRRENCARASLSEPERAKEPQQPEKPAERVPHSFGHGVILILF